MPITVVTTGATRLDTDHLRISFNLMEGRTVRKKVTVNMIFPCDPAHTPAERLETIKAICARDLKPYIAALTVADTDFTAVQDAITKGEFVIPGSR